MLVQNLEILPIVPAAEAKTWILWNSDFGAYVLDASRKHDRWRYASLRSSTGTALALPIVGAQLEVPNATAAVGACLPMDAPLSGPGLYSAALSAIRAELEPRLLEMRADRAIDDLRSLLSAI